MFSTICCPRTGAGREADHGALAGTAAHLRRTAGSVHPPRGHAADGPALRSRRLRPVRRGPGPVPRHRALPGRPDRPGRRLDRPQHPRHHPPLGPVPVHPAQPGFLHPGRLRRPADPAGPEPPGRPGPGQHRARPRGGVPDPGRHRVPGSRAGRGPAGPVRRGHPPGPGRIAGPAGQADHRRPGPSPAQPHEGNPMNAEQDRVRQFGGLEDGLRQASDWYLWGPYVSERQWGTVREDYSEDGDAWDYFPHDQARSRAYRWGEAGLAGVSDLEQRLCLGLALWNGQDAILKERPFGLTGPEGNHGEDVKEYWWYLDAVPSHAWNRWRYHYPQGPFPYEDLIDTNGARNREEPEYELLDTGAFDDDRYWITEVHYAKASADDLLMTVQVTNAGPETATLHVLPTAWFRNTWSWDVDAPKPAMRAVGDSEVGIDHPFVGPMELLAGPGPDGTMPTALFCENETNDQRLFGSAPLTPYPKDGINDHVVSGAGTVNPDRTGTKCSFWYQVTVKPGETVELRLRLRLPPAEAPRGEADNPLGELYSQVVEQRKAEADEFYADLTPAEATADEALVMRQAFGGLLWSKQLFYYDVARWLDGDPTQPAPPPGRQNGRNSRWRNFNAFDIMSMPDKWEYPWYAAWDLAFHTVSLAHVDPAFAKYQLVLLCREWFQHPNGALPAYEWDFSDVNPPVQAWAALEVFVLDGSRDLDFLSRIFDKLLVNFTWWVNREDAEGNNLFEGGFLGLDNIGPIDRSHLPVGGTLAQSDATGWMGFFAIAMGG